MNSDPKLKKLYQVFEKHNYKLIFQDSILSFSAKGKIVSIVLDFVVLIIISIIVFSSIIYYNEIGFDLHYFKTSLIIPITLILFLNLFSKGNNIVSVNYKLKSITIKRKSFLLRLFINRKIEFSKIKNFSIEKTSSGGEHSSQFNTLILVKKTGFIKNITLNDYPEETKEMATILRGFLNETIVYPLRK